MWWHQSVPGAGQGVVLLLLLPGGGSGTGHSANSAHARLDLSSTGTSWVRQSPSLLPAVQSIPAAVVLQENPLPHWKGFEQWWAPL